MSDGFVKLYGRRLLSSSLMSECWQARLVFLSMLAAADKNGRVDVGGVPGLARVINLSIDDTEAGLAALEAPDPNSRDLGHDGARVRRDGAGWLILNRVKFRELRSERQMQTAERVARHRERKSVTERYVTQSNAVKRSVTPRVKIRGKTATHCVTHDDCQVSAPQEETLAATGNAAFRADGLLVDDLAWLDTDEERAAREKSAAAVVRDDVPGCDDSLLRELVDDARRKGIDVPEPATWESLAQAERLARLSSDDPRLVDAFDKVTGTRDPLAPPPPWATRRE